MGQALRQAIDWERFAWARIALQEAAVTTRADEMAESAFLDSQMPWVELERDRYMRDDLSLEEFELRAEAILRGKDRWWIG